MHLRAFGWRDPRAYLCRFSALELGIVFADQVEIFFVKNLFLLALSSPPLSATAAFTLIRIAAPVLLIFVNNEAFADL